MHLELLTWQLPKLIQHFYVCSTKYCLHLQPNLVAVFRHKLLRCPWYRERFNCAAFISAPQMRSTERHFSVTTISSWIIWRKIFALCGVKKNPPATNTDLHTGDIKKRKARKISLWMCIQSRTVEVKKRGVSRRRACFTRRSSLCQRGQWSAIKSFS